MRFADCGLELSVLEADERHPDGTFVEDTAVVAARVAIATRPGAPSRAGEVTEVASELSRFRPHLESISPPGTLDGGDICQVEEHFLIGLSHRTNEAGARQLAAILARHGYTSSLIDIRNHRTLLHLKSGIAYLGRATVSRYRPMRADLEVPQGYERIVVDERRSLCRQLRARQ